MKPPDPTDPRGTLLMLLSVFLFAANTLLLRALSLHLPQADGWMALLYRGVIGMGMVVALYGFGRGFSMRALLGSKLVILRGVIGAFSTAAFYLSVTNAYRTLPVSRGSSIQMLLPLVTAAGAWFLFDERFTAPEFAGAALTLLATWRVAASR
ncbi:MAG: hypothetical protein B9S38_01485 [Verrucomicrobiia bacterium Tous-C4TDCM]|nr:MAG: hypothetical protein B9S38_01485 [Verrucomicrobiae bacterium Tous-C4TDCM]